MSGTTRALIISAIAATGVLAFTGCGQPGPDTGEVSPVFNEADVTFAQGMIPHHQQGIEMAEMALNNAQDPRVRALAGRIEVTQRSEVQTMSDWLRAWGKPIPSAGSRMPPHVPRGVPPGDMGRMGEATGAEFDRMFLQMMIRHHEGAIEMARTEQAQGANPDAKRLAANIEAAQTQEISQMRQILDTVPG